MRRGLLNCRRRPKNCSSRAAEQLDDRAASESFVEQALARFGDDLEVLVSGYRFFFYRSRPECALALVRERSGCARREAKLPETWARAGTVACRRHERRDASSVPGRLLGRLGLLLAQLGEFDEARDISRRVQGAWTTVAIFAPALCSRRLAATDHSDEPTS